MRYITLSVLGFLFCCGLASAEPKAEVKRTSLKYGDGKADGKQSLGGTGQLIEFVGPSGGTKLAGLRVHGSRYGMPQPPDESFLIYFLSPDRMQILHTEMAPYSLFKRGAEEWVTITFAKPVDLPEKFWTALDFRAHQRKGVFVSYDTSSKGKHSLIGLPGTPTTEPKFGGDWMIEAVPAK